MQERQPSNSLQLHWYSSWFNFCLELHTLSSSLHFHFHDSCWARNLVLFTLKLNLILLSSYFLFYLEQSKWIIKSITTLTMFINANTNRIKKGFIRVFISKYWSSYARLILWGYTFCRSFKIKGQWFTKIFYCASA